jgi:myo-inositol-1-phosphate synthase
MSTNSSSEAGAGILPDLAYVIAAIDAGIPVVNFTPNTVELPAICSLAVTKGVPIAGRDGKTGQTYFKVVLASALKAGDSMWTAGTASTSWATPTG